jgi:hypothetical protein
VLSLSFEAKTIKAVIIFNKMARNIGSHSLKNKSKKGKSSSQEVFQCANCLKRSSSVKNIQGSLCTRCSKKEDSCSKCSSSAKYNVNKVLFCERHCKRKDRIETNLINHKPTNRFLQEHKEDNIDSNTENRLLRT